MTITMQKDLEIAVQGERELVMSRWLDAPKGLVFACWTRPELISRWLLGPEGWSMPVCTVDLKVGGGCRFVWRSETGAEMGMTGTYKEIDEPNRLVSTEMFDEDWTGGEALSTLVLSDENGGTRIVQTMLYSSKEVRDAVLQSGMADGLRTAYARLDKVLAEERN